nr:nidogen-2-like [Leptinotarsa decemlineata]
MKLLMWFVLCFIFVDINAIPVTLLYEYKVPDAVYLPKGDDISSQEIELREPVVFFGEEFDSIYVNNNGFLSFQTEIPQFINIEFPLDYPIIAPFYSNVDTRQAGSVSYYQTDRPDLLRRATENIHDSFLHYSNFQATNLLIVTWEGVGYFNRGSDKANTYQVVISSDGMETFVEFLYPEDGIQWIQGTGDESGLPDARAQAGIISPEGDIFSLPGSGTEQVNNLEKWSNMGLEGQYIFKVDELEVIEPDTNFDTKNTGPPQTCREASTYCHVQAKCNDYDEGFCCECKPKYYGNGRHCVKKDLPLRVNGKVYGKINGERLEGLDLQCYVVMEDGRAYTAISKIPESVSYDIQSLQLLGGVIGFLFAKPIRNASNGYQLTGGIFNHTATITFLNTSETVRIKQKYLGLDVFDQLRLETEIQGEIPSLPSESRVNIDEYQEEYTMTAPGIIQMTAQREFRYSLPNGEEFVHYFAIDQTFVFDYCKFDKKSIGETWKLKVGKNFISYESREQIIRFGLSNKITPLGDFDPCEEGRSQCVPNSACVVENDFFRCICNPGYQNIYDGNQTLCSDINECQTGQHECDYNAQCINVVGSYICQCNPGFEGNGHLCDNAKSCQNVTCNENSECVESNGIARCKCMVGFTGNGQYCEPLIEQSCHLGNNCSPFGYCEINRETNNYYCSCLPGYAGDGYTCYQLETTTIEITTQENFGGQKVEQICSVESCWCPDGYRIEYGTNYCVLGEDVTQSGGVSDTTLQFIDG